jgi:hypothetical protein
VSDSKKPLNELPNNEFIPALSDKICEIASLCNFRIYRDLNWKLAKELCDRIDTLGADKTADHQVELIEMKDRAIALEIEGLILDCFENVRTKLADWRKLYVLESESGNE